MKIENNCVVSLHFKLTNEKGQLLDESPEDAPLIYLHGGAGIVPGLESGLAEKILGESFNITISPEDGYGEHQPHMVQEYPTSAFPDASTIKPGVQLEAQSEEGVMSVVVVKVEGDLVTIDANHPLAGMTLIFEGKIEAIRQATEDEISDGHPAE
jgi:FKBP-type peptidyl-prolyl cis-trans isomerase SlyD